MQLLSYYKISSPSEEKVSPEMADATYKRLRSRTFWGATAAYSLYYVCRLGLSVVKQPLIDDGVLTAGQLGLIGSAMLLVYAIGKFMNGFVADYCNVKRFMATGLFISALINLFLGSFGAATNSVAIPSFALMLTFAVLWGCNGWAQSMGAAPAVISLSRWFPLKERGIWYSILCTAPYLGKFIAFNAFGWLMVKLGWESCFFVASVAGVVGGVIILLFVTDTPESKGLPTIQELASEEVSKDDNERVRILHKKVLLHPGIWVIAISSAFIYITEYALTDWGILFLQKSKEYSSESAAAVFAWSGLLGVLGTVLAGWLSDKVFRGDRAKPAMISGIVSFLSLAAFLFVDGNYVMNLLLVSLFSLASGVLYCIVAGLMALDIVPRKATGAALGIVGISSYVAAALQDVASGYLIQGFQNADGAYDFTPVAVFWLIAAFLAFALPVLNWKRLKN